MGAVWLPTQAHALGSVIPQYQTPLGTCTVYREDNGQGFAFVSLGVPLFGAPLSGGSFFTPGSPGGVLSFGVDITEAFIANCLSVADSDVNLTDNIGSQANNYNTQTHMGFSFTLTTAAGGLTAGDHEYFIGTQPSTNTAACSFSATILP